VRRHDGKEDADEIDRASDKEPGGVSSIGKGAEESTGRAETEGTLSSDTSGVRICIARRTVTLHCEL